MAITRSILYNKTYTTIVSSNIKYKNKLDKYMKFIPKSELSDTTKTKDGYTISFVNGSYITCIKPSESQETIRGNRSKLIYPYVWEEEYTVSDEIIEKVLNPYMKKNK